MTFNATVAATIIAILFAAAFLPDREQGHSRGLDRNSVSNFPEAAEQPGTTAIPAQQQKPRPRTQASWSPIGTAFAEAVTADDEIIERLPAVNRDASLREAAAGRASSMQPAMALANAERYLDALRRTGEPALAGRAQRLLDVPALRQDPTAMLVRADLLQHLHRFDQAETLLAEVRERIPENAQAWLLSANVARVQGRVGDARNACERAGQIRHDSWVTVCLADLEMLDGVEDAYPRLQKWLAAHGGRDVMDDPLLAAWLGELAAFAGDHRNAERHFKRSLLLGAPAFAIHRYARLLTDQGRAEAAVVLLDWWRVRTPELSDTLLLDLAVAANGAGDRERAALLRQQFKTRADAPLIGDTPRHWRELVRFGLTFGDDARLALNHAQANWRTQKEPVDAILLDQAAQAVDSTSVRIALRDELNARGMSGVARRLPAIETER